MAAAVALERDHCGGIVLGCIGMVMTAELFNSSIETLFRGLEQEARDRVYSCLDIAAGAVLVAGLTAAAIGSIIFGRKLAASVSRLGRVNAFQKRRREGWCQR